jgi:RNA polymerase sigma-70 factor (ECF subfamily)
MARGDASALGALYDVYAPLLLALAQRILGSRSEAEDLVHEVFLEAWRHAADYDSERGTVRAWLVLRTRSRALDVRKSAAVARTVRVGDSTWFEQLAGSGDGLAPSPDRERVRRALLNLPEEQRAVLLLGYFEGLSSSEIAERMALPIGTVKSRVAAGLSRLRAALGEEVPR